MTHEPKPLKLKSYAKINLGLEVLGQLEDGYHELRTLFQTVDLADDLLLRPRREGVKVVCAHPLVPSDGTNLAARAAELLRGYAGVKRGVEVEIRKRIPVGGGLGGGSSNAAAVLMGLDRMWRLGLGPDGLHLLARKLGADVPYFLVGGTALGLGRGDDIYPLAELPRVNVVMIRPGFGVSTVEAYRWYDEDIRRLRRLPDREPPADWPSWAVSLRPKLFGERPIRCATRRVRSANAMPMAARTVAGSHTGGIRRPPADVPIPRAGARGRGRPR